MKGLSQYTGIPLDAGTKQITDVSLHGIDRSPQLAVKKPKTIIPVSTVSTMDNNTMDNNTMDDDNTIDDNTTNDNIVDGSGLRKRKGRPRMIKAGSIDDGVNRLIGRKTIIKSGSGLYPSGGSLYPSGGSIYPVRF